MTEPVSPPPQATSVKRMPLIIGGVVVVLAALGLVLFLFVFNTAERKLVGTWTEKRSDMTGPTPMQMTFNADKTYSTSVGMSGTWELKDGTIRFASKNTASLGHPPMEWKVQALDSRSLKVDVGRGVTIELER